MDVKQYRQQVEAELKKAAQSHKAADAAKTHRLLAEKADKAKVRAETIDSTIFDEENFGGLVEQYLRTLGDKREAVSVRLSALQALKVASFLGARFDAYRADFRDTLREAATDRSSTLRNSVFENLSLEKDDYAQELLMRGLEDPKAALIPMAKAIQFLARDDHSKAASVVREMFEGLDGTAKEEALRMLASDPK